eukprot:TRINITY_DN847_c0_g1_i5.p1 TRINITY_DN847_c0_g1~~TRINITY_DN847_c0_g1_i5.p1  ORF type:complete len:321 (+),score=46.91 TRINITY_DN847_c0_g1_i5:167-1129(+)
MELTLIRALSLAVVLAVIAQCALAVNPRNDYTDRHVISTSVSFTTGKTTKNQQVNTQQQQQQATNQGQPVKVRIVQQANTHDQSQLPCKSNIPQVQPQPCQQRVTVSDDQSQLPCKSKPSQVQPCQQKVYYSDQQQSRPVNSQPTQEQNQPCSNQRSSHTTHHKVVGNHHQTQQPCAQPTQQQQGAPCNSAYSVNTGAKTPQGRFYLRSDGDVLQSGESLISANNEAELRLDSKCNLLLIYNNALVHAWLNTDGVAEPPCEVRLTKNGVLKMVSSNSKVNYIARAEIQGAEAYQLVITDDGLLRLFAVRKVWTTHVEDND